MRIFLGKFSKQNPDQIKRKYYAAGEKGNTWYNGVEPGDYIFPAYEGKIIGLWKAKEYTELENPVNPKDRGVLTFEVLKEYDNVNVTNDFTRYKYFIHDLNLVNKVTKSVKNMGFIPIQVRESCPNPEAIDFKENLVDIFFAYEDISKTYKHGDIRVTINNEEEMRIKEIQRYENDHFVPYEELQKLYDERNKEDGKYTIKELLNYAEKDNASMKKNFLTSLIEELEDKGFMKVPSAIKLYDNVLVGRKRSPLTHPGETIVEPNGNDGNGIDVEFGSFTGLLRFNPNMILYGPPGTGKTYATEKIIENYEQKYFRKESNYQEALSEKRVKFLTFHQSYSYEEFIEGIRPELNETGTENIGYKLENGVFKEHCVNAEKEYIKRESNAPYIEMIHSDSSIWKISLGERKSDQVFKECIRNNDIAIKFIHEDLSELTYEEILQKLGKSDFGDAPTQNANTMNAFINDMAIGDMVLVYDRPQSIRMIGVVQGDYRFDTGFEYKHRRDVKWFNDLNYPINIHEYNGYKNLSMKTVYRLDRISISNIVEIISKNSKTERSTEDEKQVKPYYMIIDEINRGNIAKIFGELITLIEQDKRGKIKTFLPYSKKEFSVPSNLIIIGTMNTADRSLATIDTALRRRFTFVEIEPSSKIIEDPIIDDTVDVTKLMDAMNDRIIERFDRDHRIGHAYFMGIESLKNLYQVWYYKILPLLNEYFYNDLDSITYIVGKNFYDEVGNVKYLSTDKSDKTLSDFEEAIMSIYKE